MASTGQAVEPTASSGLTPTQNLNVASIRPIVPPRTLERELPMTPLAHSTVVGGREMIRRIIRRDDKRLLMVIGPCSVHDPDAAIDYAHQLIQLKSRIDEKIALVLRVYFEKPRTTVGWKGLINDPNLDGTFDMNTGLRRARKLLLQINELGLPCATELLDPIIPQYIDDLIAWASIGARTTESQTHRQMASGLSMPVGYKNSTDGSVQIAIDALRSARSPHHFIGIDENGAACVVQTRGNSDGHIILRGGSARPNYDPEAVEQASAMLSKAGLPPYLMIDCSHANSLKKHENQAGVFKSVIEQRSSENCPIIGVMLESNLFPGRQDVPEDRSQLQYGVSITDSCIGWDETQSLLLESASRL